MKKKYSKLRTLWGGVRRVLQFGLPLLLAYLIEFHPAWTSLTVGTGLEMFINWLKNHKK